MSIITPNQNRVSTLIMLVGWFSLALAVATLWPSLGTLGQGAAQVPSLRQPQVINAGPPALLLLHSDALVAPINGGTATLTARVRDAKGEPVAGVAVQFNSTLGSIDPASATTDAAG